MMEQFKKEATKKYTKLSNEEIQELYDNGQYEKVIEALIPLAIKMAGNHWRNDEFEDFNAEVMVHLCQAVNNTEKYKKLGYNNIVAYVYMQLNYDVMRINNYWQSSLIKLPSKQCHKVKVVDDYPSVTLGDYDTNIKQKEGIRTKYFYDANEVIEEFMKFIPIQYRHNIELYVEHHYNSKSYKELSEEFDVNKFYISNKITAISRYIKKNDKLKNKLAEILLK